MADEVGSAQEKFFAALRAGTAHRVPVLSTSGWFDPLFPVVESLQMYRALLAADPSYPVSLVLADIGHDRAPTVARFHQFQQILTHANAFLDTIVGGRVPDRDVRTLSAGCPEPQDTSWTVAPSWDAIRTGRLELSTPLTATGSTSSSSVSPYSKPCEAQGPAPGSACGRGLFPRVV